ncbi:MAG: dienelactone hydrolase [Gemmatimonadetes bacterium]|nr:dienelactone hydrolase [Gemmatimonadota bacterium]
MSLVLARWEIRPKDGAPPIRGDLRAPAGPPPRTAVVICHGFKGFKDWGFFPSLATAIARRGHAAVSFNFSRSGLGPEGEFSELDRFAEHTHSRNVDEIRMVLDAVTGGVLFPRRPARIGLLGHSRGGGEAVVAADEDGRVDALATWAAISAVGRASEPDIAAWERGELVYVENKRTGQRLPIAPTFWSDIVANRERLDIARAAGRLRIPWLIAHGSADETVPVSSARELFDAAGDQAELLLVDGASHTFGAQHPYAGATPELRTVADATLAWFDRHLLPHSADERAREPVL